MTIGLDGFLDERREQLFISQEYRAFFLTAQRGEQDFRRAFVDVRPFGDFNAQEFATLEKKAEALTPSAHLNITYNSQTLFTQDGATGTTSSFPVDRLDSEVKSRLLGGVWSKHTTPAPAVV